MRFDPLTREELDQIHSAALQVLEEVGFRVESPSLASRLRDAGFPSSAPDRFMAPATMVEAALKSAPRNVHLGARDADKEVILDGRRTFVTTDGCGSKTLDMEKDEVRPSVLLDVAASARLTDALDHFDIYWSMVSAQDIPISHRVARGFVAALQNCTKPIMVIDVSTPEEAEQLVQIAQVLRDADMMEGPPLSMLSSIVSPLRVDPGGMEAALIFAREKLPVIATSMPIASVTSPATAAGNEMLSHAEVLAFITILQTLYPRCPVVYTAYPSFADPRTGATNYADARCGWAAAAAAQLGRNLGVPCFVGGSPIGMMAEPDLVSFGGMLETSTLLAFEQLVLDHEEVQEWIVQARAQEISPETLAVDVVRKVGPGGHFMAQKHTVKHIKEFHTPRFCDEEVVLGSRGGEDSARQRARREARRILENHEVEPLLKNVESKLLRLAGDPAHATPG